MTCFVKIFVKSRQRARDYVRNTKGATAVEFALIAAPLVFLIMACFELALVILVSVSLDNATAKAARDIRTGITTSSNSSLNTFKQKICDNMTISSSSCMTDLILDVDTYNNFALVPTTDPVVAGAFDPSQLGYNIGSGSKVQLVRAYYEWTVVSPFLFTGTSLMANGKRVLSTKVVFKNEPF
jgi:Flp pilus assembly protein TadG